MGSEGNQVKLGISDTQLRFFSSWIYSINLSFHLFYFFFPFLLLIVLFSSLFLRLADLDKLASAHSKMLRPPMVCRLRLSVSCPLNISIIWWIISTSAIASPNMLPIIIHFLMKAVIYCKIQPAFSVNFMHYF